MFRKMLIAAVQQLKMDEAGARHPVNELYVQPSYGIRENISAFGEKCFRVRASSAQFHLAIDELLAVQSGTGTSIHGYRPHRIDHLHKELYFHNCDYG